jgi:hypothetical protein
MQNRTAYEFSHSLDPKWSLAKCGPKYHAENKGVRNHFLDGSGAWRGRMRPGMLLILFPTLKG